MPTEPGVAVPKAAEDALARARSYLNEFATKVVSDSFPPDEPQVVVEPEAKADPAVETATEEPAAPTEGETPAIEQAPTEPAAETPPEEEAEPEVPGLTPEVQESINRRIGREVAKTKAQTEAREALEAKLKELEGTVQSLSSRPSEPTVVASNVPFADLDVEKLAKVKENQQGLKDQVSSLLDQVEDDPNGVEQELRSAGVALKGPDGMDDYSVARMRRTLRDINRNVSKALEKDIPSRESFLKVESETRGLVANELPELKNPASERSRKMHSILQQIPEIKLNPKWPLFVAGQILFLEGMEKVKAAQAKAPAGATKAPASPVAPKIPARPKATPGAVTPKAREEASEQALRKAMLSGDKNARLALLEKLVG